MAAGQDSPRKQRIRAAWTACWDRGDVDALDELLAPGYARTSASDGAVQDRAGFKESILTTREAFPDLTTEVEELVEEGDRVVIRWRSRGTHTETFLDVPPTGRAVEVVGVTFATFDGDRVTAEWVTWDPRQLLRALGIISIGEGNR
ncbi:MULTISPECIES: ester cyclase [unclassified Saccharopolyspora]|uniref:ester cyclase n=1 Tax=unclassified Saccharopolyspora TaxID=2646250 RepID=UPI001CD3988F|nr:MULTISPECIES: ester cyclase [unclassified Saccharopolyspora]MCA1184871.1 ester cyclase [Saccharopolyspora sp. 6T]MCA1190596.1 ester cyclase [Saccharopolyspora sp. 6V]MCA1226466.1 ester cyclase [Saccharopolyspora sp. 6M]MCA1283081.1 ester cyclase [Saccharopolyspora sp. 7B]